MRQERRRSFQQLADEAFADLLAKHGASADLENQLRVSAGKEPVRRPRRSKRGVVGDTIDTIEGS